MEKRLPLPSQFLLLFFIIQILVCFPSQSATLKENKKPAPEAKPVFRLFKVKHRSVREILPLVRNSLSKKGRASADTVSNAVLVIDTPEQIKQIEKILEQLDIKVPHIMVYVRSRQLGKKKSRALSTDKRITNAKPGRKWSSRKNIDQEKQLMLRAQSGASAFLRIRKKIPFSSYWISLCRRNGFGYGWYTDYKHIDTGFAVRPVVYGNNVELTLTPRISFASDKVINFIEAASTVTIPSGTWVALAGSSQQQSELYGAILSPGSANSGSTILEVKAVVNR